MPVFYVVIYSKHGHSTKPFTWISSRKGNSVSRQSYQNLNVLTASIRLNVVLRETELHSLTSLDLPSSVFTQFRVRAKPLMVNTNMVTNKNSRMM